MREIIWVSISYTGISGPAECFHINGNPWSGVTARSLASTTEVSTCFTLSASSADCRHSAKLSHAVGLAFSLPRTCTLFPLNAQSFLSTIPFPSWYTEIQPSLFKLQCKPRGCSDYNFYGFFNPIHANLSMLIQMQFTELYITKLLTEHETNISIQIMCK